MQEPEEPSGWKWLVEREGFVLAGITVAAYLFASGIENGYATALRLPTTGAISLSRYINTLAVLMFIFIVYYPLVHLGFNHLPKDRLRDTLTFPYTIVFLAVPMLLSGTLGEWITYYTGQSMAVARLYGFIIAILTLLGLLTRAVLLLGRKNFAPVTYISVFVCLHLIGTFHGQRTALTRESWRVLSIEGQDQQYVILDERDGQLLTAPIVDTHQGSYEQRFLYFDRTTAGASESRQRIGPLRTTP